MLLTNEIPIYDGFGEQIGTQSLYKLWDLNKI